MKIGTQVTWTRKNGEKATGKVKSRPETKANGSWVKVMADGVAKGTPPSALRVSQLTAA